MLIYQGCDAVSEIIIYGMMILGPWALGTTQVWSIYTMSVLGCLIGICLLVKIIVRRGTGYEFSRWKQGKSAGFGAQLSQVMGWLSAMMVLYFFLGALNTSLPALDSTPARSYISVFPRGSWMAFLTCLGMISFLWGLRDWVTGRTMDEELRAAEGSTLRSGVLPERLQHVLWALVASGSLLAVEGIIQRLSGRGQLLFFARPEIPSLQFGAYAFRANACQFFNMLWPVALAFWWTQQRVSRKRRPGARIKPETYQWLLACTAVMALCPLVTGDKTGALITAGEMVVAAVICWTAMGEQRNWARVALIAGMAVVLTSGWYLGWKAFPSRAQQTNAFEQVSTTDDVNARFFAVMSPKREANSVEIRTGGWFGLGAALAIGCVLVAAVSWWFPGGIEAGQRFPSLLCVSLAGCLAHAMFDLAFQVYSILFVFVVICALLFSVSRWRTP